MSADGYFRVPRKLALAAIPQERKWALVWMISQASYAEREIGGTTLRVGETPPLSLSAFEVEFRWSRKAARLFLDYATSAKCAADTGIRVRVSQLLIGRSEGHTKGHEKGHTKGHTYLIGLVRDTDSEGHTKGHEKGHTKGQPVVKKTVRDGEKTDLGHGAARGRHEYEPEFETLWAASPYRIGNNPKIAAAKAYRARRKEGVEAAVLLTAMNAYRAFCDATNLTGTSHTMQVATFFGPNRPFEQEWIVPNLNGSGRRRAAFAPDAGEVARVSAAIDSRSTEGSDELPWQRGRT